MKYPTPASGVRAIVERTRPAVVIRATTRDDRDDETPVDMPISKTASSINARTKTIETTTDETQQRVARVESGLIDARKEVGFVAMQVVELEGTVNGLDGKVDLLVEESKEARKERQARDAALELRAARELAAAELRAAAELAARERQAERDAEEAKHEREFRKQRWIDIVKISSPILAALGVILAALAGVFR